MELDEEGLGEVRSRFDIPLENRLQNIVTHVDPVGHQIHVHLAIRGKTTLEVMSWERNENGAGVRLRCETRQATPESVMDAGCAMEFASLKKIDPRKAWENAVIIYGAGQMV